jgi:hypothetical protein
LQKELVVKKHLFRTIFLLTIVLFVPLAKAELLSCRQVFSNAVINVQSELNKKISQQVEMAQKVLSEDFANSPKKSLKSIARDLKFWSDKPVGTRSIKLKPDTIDLTLYDLTKKWGYEFGRVEVRNSAGEVLGLTIFSSSGPTYLEGRHVHEALARAYAQAWATGEFFEIRTVSFTHTHPGSGDAELFSGNDILVFNQIKAQMEGFGLKTADLEASIIFENFWTNTTKRSLVVPASSSLKSGSYEIGIVNALLPAVRAAFFLEIAQMGDQLTHGEVKAEELMAAGLNSSLKSGFVEALRRRSSATK